MHVPHAVPSGEHTDFPGVEQEPVVDPEIDGDAAGDSEDMVGASDVWDTNGAAEVDADVE